MLVHRDLWFPEWMDEALNSVCKGLNYLPVKWSNHAINRLYGRYYPVRGKLSQFINSYWIDSKDVFEVSYSSDHTIDKVVVRINGVLEGEDLIVVFDSQRVIVTIYLNRSGDHHAGIKAENYERPR